jgi:hypothetical protein
MKRAVKKILPSVQIAGHSFFPTYILFLRQFKTASIAPITRVVTHKLHNEN